MAATLSLENDIVPMLAAYQAAKAHGIVSIHFRDGQVAHVEVRESMQLAHQVRSWLRRFVGRRSPPE
ncbi:MAG: hypothetical protein ACE5IZ_09410 [Dehalococcoidia bacterium]